MRETHKWFRSLCFFPANAVSFFALKVAGLACAILPSHVAERLVRHMNAAQISGYVGLNAIGHGSPYSKEFFFDHYNAQHQLMTEDEMKLVSHLNMDSGGDFMKSMCTWCQVQISQARKDKLIDTYQEQQFQDRILVSAPMLLGAHCSLFQLTLGPFS